MAQNQPKLGGLKPFYGWYKRVVTRHTKKDSRMNENIENLQEYLKEAKTKKIEILDFDSVEGRFDFFPSQLFELTDVKEINFLWTFDFNEFPKEITKLKWVKKISISGKFGKFPIELVSMENLTYLSLGDLTLEELPYELNNWHNLTYLNLGTCSKISRMVGLPPNLSYLFLPGDSFNKFPSKIFDCILLRKIVLHRFNFAEFPVKLFQLPNLISLFLGDNSLKDLPNEIKKLDLDELWLDNNLFTSFPKVICEIPTLTSINLTGNQIKSIPAVIKKLSNLDILDLTSNNLKTFPKSVLKCTSLTQLNLGNQHWRETPTQNSIKEIPKEILGLENLTTLNLRKLPIENIPQEIINDGLDAIKNYIKSIIEADQEEYLYEAKMVVVGRGEVGKTVLTKKLTNPNYSLSKSLTTKGISILKNPFEFKMDDLKNRGVFRFNIWDFGGQEKYDATHQLFITNRSIYLFLTEARAESNYHDVFHWLNTISLFSNNSPVIIILSKYDERKKILPESTYKAQFGNIVDFVDVSCADGFEYTLENLKNSIKSAISLLPQTKLTLSNHWIDIRDELEHTARGRDYIEYDEYLKICKDNKLDKERADFLSEYLNDLGVIIHHKQDLLLRKTVFINTDWCVDGMYKVLDDEDVFNNKGKFSDAHLEVIWKESRFATKQPELIRLMQDYSLCFELADRSGYIAPDLLPPDKPNDIIWDNTNNLRFEYQYTFMPAGMISRFIVKSHSFIKNNIFWKYGVMLTHDNTEAIIEEDYIKSKIKISLLGPNKKGLLSLIKMFIDEVHKDFDKGNRLEFEEMVPCNCAECLERNTPHFFKFTVLKKFESKNILETNCEKSGDFVNIKTLINDVQIYNPIDHFENDNDLRNFVLKIIEEVLEHEILYKEGFYNFWRDRKSTNPKDEVEVQPYICNTIDNHCKIRGVNLSREVKEGNGNVDILFTCTNRNNQILKVCVEIKKAHHQDVETAIATQLPSYLASSKTKSGIYLVLWYKNEKFNSPKTWQIESIKDTIQRNNPDNKNIILKILTCNKGATPSKIGTTHKRSQQK